MTGWSARGGCTCGIRGRGLGRDAPRGFPNSGSFSLDERYGVGLAGDNCSVNVGLVFLEVGIEISLVNECGALPETDE